MLTTAMMLLENPHFQHVVIVIGKFVIVQIIGLKAVVIQCGEIEIRQSLSSDYSLGFNYYMEVLFGD